MSLTYPIKLEPDDNGTLLVTCPALPEVTTFGKDEAEAIKHARVVADNLKFETLLGLPEHRLNGTGEHIGAIMRRQYNAEARRHDDYQPPTSGNLYGINGESL